MNNRYSMSMAFLVLISCVSMRADVEYSFPTTGDEIPGMLATRYNELSKKWLPLLNEVSKNSLEAFLNNWAKELMWKMSSSYDHCIDKECVSRIDEMSARPYQFVREELVRDIRALAKLEHEARILGLSDAINSTFLKNMQNLRVRIAELPEYKTEREVLARNRKAYHACIVALATATIGYIAKYGEKIHYPIIPLAGFAGFMSLMDLVNN